MEQIAPLGPVYQAGTLSGNPVAVAAGLATLAAIEAPGFYDRARARRRGRCAMGSRPRPRAPACRSSPQSVGGMFGLYFAAAVPDTYDAVMACDKERFNRFFHAMLDAGVYLAPSAFEAGFVSAAHTADDIAATVARAEKAFAARADARRRPTAARARRAAPADTGASTDRRREPPASSGRTDVAATADASLRAIVSATGVTSSRRTNLSGGGVR